MWSNFHMHSNYCDGKDTIAAYAARASSLKMRSIGFSSHAPLPFDCKWCMKPGRVDEYVREIEASKKSVTGIEIYKGLEIDYIPGVISPADFRNRLDYTIGSIHFVDSFPDGRRWEIDGTHSFFLEGYEQVFESDIRAVMSRYYKLTREMVESSQPDIVGHLDKIKIQNIDGKFFSESDLWYRNEIIKTLDVIKASGSIIEVNTRGIYQKKSTTTYPGPWILELIKSKNIPITISSDAHHPDDITNEFTSTATLLLKTGFRKIMMLRDGAWKQFDFTPDGIQPA